MKTSPHAVHPEVAPAVTALHDVLKKYYPSRDFALHLYVEGILVASVGDKEDTEPAVWEGEQIETEVQKRADAAADKLKESAEATKEGE